MFLSVGLRILERDGDVEKQQEKSQSRQGKALGKEAGFRTGQLNRAPRGRSVAAPPLCSGQERQRVHRRSYPIPAASWTQNPLSAHTADSGPLIGTSDWSGSAALIVTTLCNTS